MLAVTGLVGIACGGDDDDDDATPAATTAAATTAAASPTTAASPTAAAAYPVKVTDLLGRSVEIKAKPKTIVAISPTAVEYVYAVGGTVVGRSQSAEFPEAAKQAKEVGTAYQPSFEAILALKPDLVVADSVIHIDPRLRGPIEQLGVPVIFAGAENYKQVIAGLTLLGTVLDAQAKAKEVISGIEKARSDAKTALGTNKIAAVILIAGRDQTLYSAKSTSFAGDILAQVGVTNPAANEPDSGPGFPGYTTLAQEKLIQYNPDYIFTITPAPAPAPRLSTLVPQIPPFKGLKAVTGSKVIELNLEEWLQAPGPRIANAFKALADAVKAKP
ncbi:MAG: ABC transporter substrate-binding protein [Dehalococcoidia bacterium]